MLSKIKQLLGEHGGISVRELTGLLGVEASALEPMLQILLDKGQIRPAAAGCGGTCPGCACSNRTDLLVYELGAKEL
jgi:predicted transcriptional regulator